MWWPLNNRSKKQKLGWNQCQREFIRLCRSAEMQGEPTTVFVENKSQKRKSNENLDDKEIIEIVPIQKKIMTRTQNGTLQIIKIN